VAKNIKEQMVKRELSRKWLGMKTRRCHSQFKDNNCHLIDLRKFSSYYFSRPCPDRLTVVVTECHWCKALVPSSNSDWSSRTWTVKLFILIYHSVIISYHSSTLWVAKRFILQPYRGRLKTWNMSCTSSWGVTYACSLERKWSGMECKHKSRDTS